MNDSQKNGKNMSRALTNHMQEQRATETMDRWRKKDTERKNAEAVIYAHVSKWMKKEIAVGGPIPWPRAKPGFGQLNSTILGGVDEVRKILDASKAIDTSTLRVKVRKLKKLRSDIEAMITTLNEFDWEQMARAENTARNLHTNIEGRVVTALGACNVARLGLDVIFVGLYQELTKMEQVIKDRDTSGPGRAKDEAAHLVALEAAKLYAKVTGKSPTYSEGPNGLSGQYTPFLRELYNAFGWKARTLRTGATAAINSVKSSDLEPPIMTGLGALLTGYRT